MILTALSQMDRCCHRLKCIGQRNKGQFIGPHVYPTTQGPVKLDTGDRLLKVDRSRPSPLRFFVSGDEYQFLQLKLPLPTRFSLQNPQIEDVQVFPGIKSKLHLFGAAGAGRLNLLGTDEQARDQLSRLMHGGRISLFIGILGTLITFPLGLLVGGISGYFGGILDAVLMRIVEVIMVVPAFYLLVALGGVLPPGLTSAQRFVLIVVITSFISWAGLARVVRGQVLSIKERVFVQAAKAMGGAIALHHCASHLAANRNLYHHFSDFDDSEFHCGGGSLKPDWIGDSAARSVLGQHAVDRHECLNPGATALADLVTRFTD